MLQGKKDTKKSMRIVDGDGSATLTGLFGKLQAKKDKEVAEIQAKAAAAAERAAKKTASDSKAVAEIEKWRRCQPACSCQPAAVPPLPCPMAGWYFCRFCDSLKKRKCGVRSCVEAETNKAAVEVAAADEEAEAESESEEELESNSGGESGSGSEEE